jgi:hypothetical protein
MWEKKYGNDWTRKSPNIKHEQKTFNFYSKLIVQSLVEFTSYTKMLQQKFTNA